MEKEDLDFFHEFNLETDAVIVNQSHFTGYEQKIVEDSCIEMYSYVEKGVGRSRNSALLRSNADICLMADDDMRYVSGYKQIILKAFENNPNADVILFNVAVEDRFGNVKLPIKSNGRVHFYNSLRYGTVNIAFKRDKIVQKQIFFSLLFGGGAKYGSGEDTLFLTECLKKGIKIYAHSEIIADIKYRHSSWFEGYTEKYFVDKGALFAAISPKMSYLIAAQFLFRKKSIVENLGRKKVWGLLCQGIKEFSKGN
ncbi:glycosyltransferase family A protein [Exiguobacterium aurantiacum]|uniref:Glycosyltransferase family 2 protein n=1 Tax=Exiguobacterium aurantiacum TaxID=33987 RepID=A0ABY5FQX4_9BACL|nr:glycosyltransferase family A protein [Exiguobacterium aurantiacum]UTT43518.1 glycosyltransferase family 2 protein [Exiguobacterium aurantiacum]